MFSHVNFDGLFSLFIFCIEILFILNLLYFANRNRTNLIGLAMLTVLACYQFIEFLICNQMIQSPTIAYFAFVDISFLPPFGLMLSLSLNNKLKKVHLLAFVPALTLLIYYAGMIETFKVVRCSFFYAMYHYPFGDLYGFIYYIPVILTLIIFTLGIKNNIDPEKIFFNKVLLTGYLLFVIPSIIAFIVYPEFWRMVESVMCKFAFLFACCVSYFILKNGRLRKEIKVVF
ncbi:MAG: hypothetical protein Q8N03_00230 [Ignavibacteria bacterium]|nr:hypothetical protein [Ignavibacteria bacterium]